MSSSDLPSPLPFVLPLIVLLAAGSFEPRIPGFLPESIEAEGGVSPGSGEINSQDSGPAPDDAAVNESYFREKKGEAARKHTIVYGLKILLVAGLIAGFFPVYRKYLPSGWGWASVVTGAFGVIVWILLCNLKLENYLWTAVGLEGQVSRHSINPFAAFDSELSRNVFLAIRFFGLVVVVPVAEELFLRGFLMRYFESTQWWEVGFTRLGLRAMLVAPLYGAVTHPGEIIAAVVWFSLITWLVSRSGRFLDAVIAHATTNLLLGIYICVYGEWHLW